MRVKFNIATMQFALINGIKSAPCKNGLGNCPLCNEDVFARCGNIKVHHWAHKSKKVCDPWWENETLWHRTWKNHFPTNWQEFIQFDSITNEKHVADLKSPDGLIVEFQHSYLTTEERLSRERFYQHMIWILDGTRRKNDLTRFNRGAAFFRGTKMPNVFFVPYPEEIIPKEWLDSTKPIIFDFNQMTDEPNGTRNQKLAMVWKPKGKPKTQCMFISKYDLINWIISGDLITVLKEF